jgi:hypothetical protein
MKATAKPGPSEKEQSRIRRVWPLKAGDREYRVASHLRVAVLSRFETVGAQSLRFLQGRVPCCRYHVLLCPADFTVPMGCTTCTSSPIHAINEDRCWDRRGRVTVSSACLNERRIGFSQDLSPSAASYPPFAKCAKSGAPKVVVCVRVHSSGSLGCPTLASFARVGTTDA